jgi:hypothetical protein
VQLAGVGHDARDALGHVQLQLDRLGQVGPRGLDDRGGELDRVDALDRDRQLVGVGRPATRRSLTIAPRRSASDAITSSSCWRIASSISTSVRRIVCAAP